MLELVYVSVGFVVFTLAYRLVYFRKRIQVLVDRNSETIDFT